MTEPDQPGNADAELRQLVSLLLDDALDERQRQRLEQRLRADPEALPYCARTLRFEVLMEEALHPDPLEFEEIRRVRFNPRNPASTWIFQRLRTIRRLRTTPRRRRIFPWLVLLALLLGAAAMFWGRHSLPASWRLRNGDFEEMDLARSPHGIGTSILDWQDYFHSPDASLCDIGRTSGGKIFAKSGRNAARLNPRGFLTQRLLGPDDRPLGARPGMTVVLRGWSYCHGNPPFPLRCSLRFVASSYPEMIQYEPAFATVPLQSGGWHPFEVRLTLPTDLDIPPSDVNLPLSSAVVFKKHGRNVLSEEAPPLSANISGKPLTLSIDQDSPGATVYLDDLSIRVIETKKSPATDEAG